MTRNVDLGPGAEFDAIRSLLARWGSRAVGIGDDAAVLDVPRGDKLVVSVDTAVEGRHFRSDWSSPEEIGYHAVVAALSDIAAMAARPLGILIAMTLPSSWHDRVEQLGDGIGSAADIASAPIIGGNLSAGEELSITTTVLGSAFIPLTRSGARPGDRLYVTGVLGGPGAALRALQRGDDAGAHRDRLIRPRPRIHEAQWLADNGASAAIDISDGLIADVRHVATASGVGVEIDGGSVPRVVGVSLDEALASGGEYELAVACSGAFDIAAFRDRFGLALTEIGRVLRFDESHNKDRINIDGACVANVLGHDHFSQ